MMIIGITGSIASGKSTVARLIAKKKYPLLFNNYKIKHGIEKIETDFLAELTKISNEEFFENFIDLDEDQKIIALNLCKLTNVRLFSAFLKNIFRFYYSDKRVLSLINVGSSPPFPQGNIIEEDDWTILMPVYARGSIYKEFDDE